MESTAWIGFSCQEVLDIISKGLWVTVLSIRSWIRLNDWSIVRSTNFVLLTVLSTVKHQLKWPTIQCFYAEIGFLGFSGIEEKIKTKDRKCRHEYRGRRQETASYFSVGFSWTTMLHGPYLSWRTRRDWNVQLLVWLNSQSQRRYRGSSRFQSCCPFKQQWLTHVTSI